MLTSISFYWCINLASMEAGVWISHYISQRIVGCSFISVPYFRIDAINKQMRYIYVYCYMINSLLIKVLFSRQYMIYKTRQWCQNTNVDIFALYYNRPISKNLRVHPFNIPQCDHSEQKYAYFCFEGALWDMGQVHSGICELDQLAVSFIFCVICHLRCHR